MASAVFKPSRIVAVALIAIAGLWVGSGYLVPHAEEPKPEARPTDAAASTLKVAVETATPEVHPRNIDVSCVTRADRRAMATARAAGVIEALNVKRGDTVKAGDVLATISDEGRTAAVAQAKAFLEQRQAEYQANKKLIEGGNAPRINLPAVEAAVAAAEAALAAAEAEARKSSVIAPLDGVVDQVPAELGQAIQVGTNVAEIVGPDPMLAVGAVTEAHRSQLSTGQTANVTFIDGRKATGTITFISLSAEKATRTYPVEAKIANADAAIADGVTCEMSIALEPMQAAAVPRSALVFSDEGRLGIRIADENSQARFVPVDIVDDGREAVWVSGIDQPVRVIVVGQDFVKEGDTVEAVSAAKVEKAAEPPA
jgi:multidrug efflux system membrane fusion protein